MPRLMLSDEHWSKLKGMMLQENIYNKRDFRMIVEGMFYRLRVSCPWRDLPSCFGRWNSVTVERFTNRLKKGATAVIPRRSSSVIGNADMGWSLYRHRHLVENAIARLKHFRGLATRYDKLKRNYQSSAAMACGFLWPPMQ